MKAARLCLVLFVLSLAFALPSFAAGKEGIYATVDAMSSTILGISDFIYKNPESGNKEFKAVDLLTKTLAENGFTIEKGVAGLETAFVATYVNAGGGPAISFMAEYDALDGLGHGCGHNIIAASCTGAAIALSKNLGSTPATVIVFGTPAEETTSGKIPMAAAGLFKRADVGMQMHPGSGSAGVGMISLALNLIDFNFEGKASHAAASPEMGRSALDGVMLMFNAIDMLREHVRQDIRMHGIVTNGGQAANIVPEKAASRWYVRGLQRPYLNTVVERVYDIAKGAALATGTTVKIAEVKQYDNVVNVPSFMKLIQEVGATVGYPEMPAPQPGASGSGSTDFGTASSQIPCVIFGLPNAPKGVAGHSREFVAACGSPEAAKSALDSSKIMAAAGLELIQNPALLAKIKADWKVVVSGK